MVEEVGYLGSNDSRFEALAALILSELAKNTWVWKFGAHTVFTYIRRVENPHRPLHHMYH